MRPKKIVYEIERLNCSEPIIYLTMEWSSYKKKFCLAAINSNFDEDYISRCLDYAYRLNQNKYPIIYSQEHLSNLVGYDQEYLHKISNSQKHCYKNYSIAKASGGVRVISEPLPSLKEIQRWVLDEILYKHPVSKYAKAYVPNLSIKDNARFHRKQPVVLSLDLSDFFGTIKWFKVYDVFVGIGYSKPVSVMLSNLCTLNKSLPQGAPTSPALSNIICLQIDNRISKYAAKNKIRYTRYADDITLSGNLDVGAAIKIVSDIVSDYGFKLNNKKTRAMKSSKRQEVTGIVVNENMRVSKDLIKELRHACYYIDKYGLESHIDRNNITQSNYIHHLLGIANYIKFIRPSDKDAIAAITILRKYTVS